MKNALNTWKSLITAGGVASLLFLASCNWTPPVGSGEVLFQDDFSREISGWEQRSHEAYQLGYQQDSYLIEIHSPNTDAWATPGLSFENARIQVEASMVAGPEDNLFGLICRYQDPRNFYFFVISSDGYAGIGLNKDGRRQLISDEALLPSAAVHQGQAGNVLRADCIDFNLLLYVNGILVARAQAAEWPRGDVGLIAGSYDQGGVQIIFDNFSVVKP